jgi:ankyrin repeat protein
VDAVNEVNHTALKAAVKSCQVEVAKFLLDAGASASHQNIYGHNALHCAVSTPSPFSSERQLNCVRLLLNTGHVAVDANDGSGCTALIHAAWFGRGESVELLLEAGADSRLRDQKGRTAADAARERGHFEIAERLERAAS